jgi:hypothetical protein
MTPLQYKLTPKNLEGAICTLLKSQRVRGLTITNVSGKDAHVAAKFIKERYPRTVADDLEIVEADANTSIVFHFKEMMPWNDGAYVPPINGEE